MSLILNSTSGGSVTIVEPATASNFTQTLAAATGTLAPLVNGTVVAASGSAAVDFTGIPSYAKRITIMFSGLSTNGTSDPLIQLGDSGGIEITGYVAAASTSTATSVAFSSTAGFPIAGSWSATVIISGIMTLVLQDPVTNTWVASTNAGRTDTAGGTAGGGFKSTSAVLDRVRITTAGGVNTFDAGTINIIWE